MNIKNRLTFGFSMVATITLLIGIAHYVALNQSVANQKEIITSASQTRQAEDLARKAALDIKIQVQDWKDILLRGHDPVAFEKYMAAFNTSETQTREDLDSLKALMPNMGLPTTGVDAVLEAHAGLGGKYREALKSFDANKESSAFVVDKLVKGMDRPVSEALEGVVATIDKFAQESSAAIQNKTRTDARNAEIVSIAGSAANVFVAIAFGLLLSRKVGQQIRAVADPLAEGSRQVASAASQVSSASHTLAGGASEQAASLEETSASLEELSSMTKHNADNAQKANDLAKQARAAADKGAGDMQTMSTAMEAIKVSSDDIAKIIKTIDEIAFQTNILALNAAVEAARAGEAGMGFAVVADEVRNLAQRSAQAAKETAAKIEGAIANTGQGVEISVKVVATLNDIVTKVRQVDELVSEVANASNEQTQGITQINTAVSQMDKVTQSNSANAEESASAAEELSTQAEKMKHSVADLLQLVGGQSQAAATKPAAPAVRIKEVSAPAPATKRSAPIKHNGNGNGHPQPAPALATAENGRSEIPMEDDFKNF
jgi:methyl-accepting chemotaxis protein